MWFNTFDGVFFITVITIITGSFGLMLRYCLKSKCDSIKCCWGCLIIHRNVEIEENSIEENSIEENIIEDKL
jgi:hypothetical protein